MVPFYLRRHVVLCLQTVNQSERLYSYRFVVVRLIWKRYVMHLEKKNPCIQINILHLLKCMGYEGFSCLRVQSIYSVFGIQ